MIAPRIKICGITNPTDAMAAAQASADWLGLIFVPNTPRFVPLESAKEMMRQLRVTHPKVEVVGVFQNQSLPEIEHYLQILNLDRVQLHGQESPDFCAQISVPVVKTLLLHPELPQRSELEISALHRQAAAFLEIPQVQTLLLDLPKGSGSSSVLDMARSDADTETLRAFLSDFPCLLAGGLTPDNIQQALQTFQPAGVDVASGVEQGPGQKDIDQIKRFCHSVKNFKPQPNHGENASCNP
ncbi:phosphoribosylanthranilate isomerase [Vampirovibrio chlorellavorus]|uniref:phosphoribosylanthranilate isomerase n=1 Tax=Vampirovibrio chlorellavorus TaxID=758823 RepID=UPI0026F147D5|nr:phosphoribosylanthranilate isomerase [Vampirovibrio chlorellavorus]